jgi:DNA replication licensing factor MCM2
MGPKRKREEEKKSLTEKEEIEEIGEAIEERMEIEEEEKSGSSEGEGDDLMENLEKDYEPIPELDEYQREGLDDEQYSQMDPEERKRVEDMLNERDKGQRGRSKRIPTAILDELEGYSDDEENLRKRRKVMFTKDVIESEEYKDTESYLNREQVKGKLSEWLRQPHVIRYIHGAFSKFIKNYKDDEGKSIYEARIIDMCSNNKQSLEVNFVHLVEYNKHLAEWIIQSPQLVLPLLDDVAFNLTCEIFPQYQNIYTEIFVRIRDLLEINNLRELRYFHLQSLVKIRGVVTKRTNVFPYLKKAFYICNNCGERKVRFM